MNAPKIRFPNFIDNYEKLKYGDVLKIKSGRDQKQVECENGQYPILGTGGEIGRSNSYLYNKPSVLIGRKGTINKPQYMETPFWTVDTLFYSEIFDTCFPKYLYYSFQNVNWKKYDESTGVPSLSCSTIEKVDCFIPKKDEQIKVSNFLSLLDKKIELQSKKIEDLKLFKLSLREKLFYMFPTNNKKLSEILTKWNKKNKDNKYSYVESVSNKFGFIAQNEQFEDRNVASNDTSNYYVIEKGVFAYNPSRLNVGSLALKQNDKVSLVSPLYECFTTNQNQDFMLEWFQSKEFRRGTFSKYEGGVRNTLNFNNLSSIEIKLPNLESQNKIVKVLSCYNKMIDLELKKLNKLLEFKKGLMQQLFI